MKITKAFNSKTILLSLFGLIFMAMANFSYAQNSDSLVLHFDGFVNCQSELSSYGFIEGLKVHVSNLQNIKSPSNGLPTFEKITGAPYSGTLNTKLKYMGFSHTYGYYANPNITFTSQKGDLPLVWLSFQSKGADKSSWVGSLHFRIGSGQKVKTCIANISNS